jgi:hypothetical protein
VASASHLAELEIAATDVASAWSALEPVITRLAGPAAVKSDYHVGQPDSDTSVGGADLDDCLNRVDSPTSISVTYTAGGGPGLEPTSIELRVTRHRRFKELNVNLRVAGSQSMQTLGLFDRIENGLTDAISRFSE